MTEAATPLTPMMAQWHDCKSEAKDALLFFRLGDFYEAFHEDANLIAKTLGLTLTARQGIPMCGVPFHSSEMYIDKLVAKGFKVAIAEQMEDPKSAKGLVKREVARIVTPGTLVNSQLLTDKKNNFFAAIAQIGSTFGLSFLDLSTGEFNAFELNSEQEILDALCRIKPSEFLASPEWKKLHPQFFSELSFSFPFLVNERDLLDLKTAQEVLQAQFQVHHLSAFHLTGKNSAILAAGSLLLYLKEEMNANCDHILQMNGDVFGEVMQLDRACLRNLGIIASGSEDSAKNTLLDVLDQTATPMGGRQLRHLVLHPLLSLQKIHARQERIELLISHAQESKQLHKQLSFVRDLERLMMKMSARCATPRDFLTLAHSLEKIPAIKDVLAPFYPCEALQRESELTPLVQKILHGIVENPPQRMHDGDIFRDGFHPELDTLRSISRQSLSFLAQYQNQLREQTGIKALKVNFTKAFGYYIETSKLQSDKVPSFFQRSQTLVNTERFVTEELKKFEHQVLSAEDKAKDLEAKLFEELREETAKHAGAVHLLAKTIGEIDALLSLALVAQDKEWIRPVVDDSCTFDVQGGRHPMVEHVVGRSSFIPNDTKLDEKSQMMLITGPNMAGKSTYIRQVAIIAILAQIGSFVPASFARIGLIDKVFSRIGASDDLARGQSTFMVEMAETANILQNATSRSLILLDEIGRGTSTYDGISIAWAVAEYLLTTQKKQAKTLFATHYWELTKLSDFFPHAQNFQTAVQEISSGIVFLRKIIPGGTDKSYGIHVAKLAGLPKKVTERAEAMLKKLETRKPQKIKEEQMSLF